VIKVDQSCIECNLKDIQPIKLRSIRKMKFEKLYNSLIHEHHYLGYAQPVGENFKYIAKAILQHLRNLHTIYGFLRLLQKMAK